MTLYQAIRLPYGNHRFAMYVFLPRKYPGLANLSRKLPMRRIGTEMHPPSWTIARAHSFCPNSNRLTVRIRLMCSFQWECVLRSAAGLIVDHPPPPPPLTITDVAHKTTSRLTRKAPRPQPQPRRERRDGGDDRRAATLRDGRRPPVLLRHHRTAIGALAPLLISTSTR